jgi:HEAT repeat protein
MAARSDPALVESLVAIIEEGSQIHQRRNAVWMLGRVVDGHASKRKAVEALRDVLGEDDELLSQFAATGLAEIGGRLVEHSLLEVIDKDEYSEDAVAMAAFTLGKVGGRRSRKRLEKLVDETDNEDVRRRAFSAISKLGSHT